MPLKGQMPEFGRSEEIAGARSGVAAAHSEGVPAGGWLFDEWVNFGPLFQTFPLTLEPGEGTEAVGPLFYRHETADETLWAIPPLVSSSSTRDGQRNQVFVLPPVFTYRRYGEDARWQLAQWINGGRQRRIDDPEVKRFNLFPLYFSQDAVDPEQDYWALFPFYGTLKNRFFRDEAEFVLFPVWLKTRKGTMVTKNVLFPLFHVREGPDVRGWQFWPIVGHEQRKPSVRTNVEDQLEVVPGHDKFFALWPVFFRNRLGLGTDNPARVDAALPLFYLERSPKRDHTAVLWPLFSWTNDREEKFRQFNAPWPLVGFARGEHRRLDRVIPLFSIGRKEGFETESYLWPLYRRRHHKTAVIDRVRWQLAVVLYSDEDELNTATGQRSRRIDSWPFFTWTRDGDGTERLQVLSLFEPVRRGAWLERNWSPLWSIWRQELDPASGRSSQSLFWNLYRRDAAPGVTKGSLLFGLVQYQKTSAGRRWRWLHLGPPMGGPGGAPESANDVPESR
jgi:hypothetical protein